MIGKTKGFNSLLKDWLRRPLISHWCLAHRTEKIYETAMKKFKMFKNIESGINSSHSFYSRSSKRTTDLDKFIKKTPGLKKFRLKHIFEVRYVMVSKSIFHLHDLMIKSFQMGSNSSFGYGETSGEHLPSDTTFREGHA